MGFSFLRNFAYTFDVLHYKVVIFHNIIDSLYCNWNHFIYQHVYMNCTQLRIIRMHELCYMFQR